MWLTVVSANRSNHVTQMRNMIGPATWYVPKHNRRDYENAGADNIGLGSDTNVTAARNQAIQDAFNWRLPCVQLDDDLKWIKQVAFGVGEEKNTALHTSVEYAIGQIVRALQETGFKLGGTAPTNNPYFSRNALQTRAFVRSPFWVVMENELRLDRRLLVKFDYDYTLQHIQKFGGVARLDEFVTQFDYGTQPGGHVDSRTMETQMAAIRYLESKWGTEIIKRNPRRQGEILLRVPRPQRVVLT